MAPPAYRDDYFIMTNKQDEMDMIAQSEPGLYRTRLMNREDSLKLESLHQTLSRSPEGLASKTKKKLRSKSDSNSQLHNSSTVSFADGRSNDAGDKRGASRQLRRRRALSLEANNRRSRSRTPDSKGRYFPPNESRSPHPSKKKTVKSDSGEVSALNNTRRESSTESPRRESSTERQRRESRTERQRRESSKDRRRRESSKERRRRELSKERQRRGLTSVSGGLNHKGIDDSHQDLKSSLDSRGRKESRSREKEGKRMSDGSEVKHEKSRSGKQQTKHSSDHSAKNPGHGKVKRALSKERARVAEEKQTGLGKVKRSNSKESRTKLSASGNDDGKSPKNSNQEQSRSSTPIKDSDRILKESLDSPRGKSLLCREKDNNESCADDGSHRKSRSTATRRELNRESLQRKSVAAESSVDTISSVSLESSDHYDTSPRKSLSRRKVSDGSTIYFPPNTPRQRQRRFSLSNEENADSHLNMRQTSLDAIASPTSSRSRMGVQLKRSSSRGREKKNDSSTRRRNGSRSKSRSRRSRAMSPSSSSHYQRTGAPERIASPIEGSRIVEKITRDSSLALTDRWEAVPVLMPFSVNDDNETRKTSDMDFSELSISTRSSRREKSLSRDDRASDSSRSLSSSARRARQRSRSRSRSRSHSRSTSRSHLRVSSLMGVDDMSGPGDNAGPENKKITSPNLLAVKKLFRASPATDSELKRGEPKRSSAGAKHSSSKRQSAMSPTRRIDDSGTRERMRREAGRMEGSRNRGGTSRKATRDDMDLTRHREKAHRSRVSKDDLGGSEKDRRSLMRSASEADVRERRRNSRRRLLEAEAAAKVKHGEILTKNDARDRAIARERASRLPAPYMSRSHEDSESDYDEDDEGINSSEKDMLGKASSHGRSTTSSKIINPQRRRRRRTSVGHEMLQRSLNNIDTDNLGYGSDHSSLSKDTPPTKKEAVWKTRRRRHSAGLDDA
jgi:hypothetical protein